MTLTNVNFNEKSILSQIEKVRRVREALIPRCSTCASPCGRNDEYDMNRLWSDNEDIRSLKSLILFGLKGIAAYAYHAMVLGYSDNDVNNFFYEGLFAVGEINLKCMELLDKANTETYGNPVPTEVVSFPGMVHIGDEKDFTPVIEKALELGGFNTDKEFTGINGGKKCTRILRNKFL